MSWTRIYALLLQEIYLLKRSIEIAIDLFYWSIASILIFGLVTIFLIGKTNNSVVQFLLIGTILWEVFRINHWSISEKALWNIWSRNLSNMFVAPLRLSEYLVAQMISGTVKSFLVFILISIIANLAFHFNIFQLGLLNLAMFYINLSFFAWAVGLMLLGLVFKYGTRIQSLTWSVIAIFQPLCAVFFPVKVLPQPIQTIANIFPLTHVFEAARYNLYNPAIDWNNISVAFIQNAFYFSLGIFIFNLLFNASKRSGQFAKNEE